MRKVLLLLVLLCAGLPSWAATTFTVDGATYTITDAANKKVAIGNGSVAAISTSTYGTFSIPSSVSYNGDTYTVTAIGDYAFFACHYLSSVIIPSSVTSIGWKAFYGCSFLKSIEIPSSVKTIDGWAFYSSGLESVLIPLTVTSISVGAFTETSGLITVDSRNPNYSSRDGVLYNKTQTILMHCPTSVAQVTIPNTVTSIAVAAFQGCYNLKSITIPTSVLSIETDAFENCSNLTAINIPCSVTSIFDGVFSGCKKLSLITVDSANQIYSSLDGVLFNKNQTILLTYPGGKKDKSYSIPNSVTSIRAQAFSQTSLKEITIPSSVNSIGSYSFINTALNSIYVSKEVLNAKLEYDALHITDMSQCKLYVPANSRTLFAAADQWKVFNIVEADAYTVSATSNPSAAGLISGTGSFLKGSMCNLTAKPVSGYTFINWTDKSSKIVANTAMISSIIISQDTTFTANFIASENAASLSLSCNNSLAGSVSGNGNFYKGDSRTVTAKPNYGYSFVNWTDQSGTVLSTEASFTFPLVTDMVLIANYAVNKYVITLTSSYSVGGTVSGAGSFDYNTDHTVTATPNDGYGFKGWKNSKGTLLSPNKSFTFTLSQDTALTATFTKTYDFSDTNGLYYKITSATTASVTYRNVGGGDYSGDIAVPATATYNGTTYKVTAIGDSAFINCSGLTSVSMASSVTSVGRYAFYKCTGLASLTLSDAITTMDVSALAYCSGLSSVTLPPGLKFIPNNLFYGCTQLASVVIPSSVTSIGNSAFEYCSTLASITIPSSVTSLGRYAFSVCTSLTSVILPSSLKSIPDYLFYQCTKLASLVIPSSVTSIGGYAFYNCNSLAAIYANNVSPSNIQLGSGVFAEVPTASCTLYVPTGSKTLYAAADQWKAFTVSQQSDLCALFVKSNSSFGGVTTGSNSYALGSQCTVSAIANKNYTFTNWTDKSGTVLSTATDFSFILTRDTTVIANFTPKKYTIALVASPSTQGTVSGAGAFDYGSSNTVTATPNDGYRFQGWKNSKGTVLSSNKSFTFTLSQDTTLTATFAKASYDFSDTNGLYYKITSATTASVTYRNGNDYSGDIAVPATATYNGTTYNVTAIGDSAFINCNGLTSLSMAGSVTSVGRYAFYKCTGLARLTLSDAITSMGVYALAYCSGSTSVTLPSGLKSIPEFLFYQCTKLASVVIPSSVTSIGYDAFYACSSLTSITIPSSVTSIGIYAFYSCSSLTSVTLPSGLKSIPDYLFYGCTKLASVVIPSSVTSIGPDAFYACSSLPSITIPSSVTSIGIYAFYSCSSLTSVYSNSVSPSNITLGSSVFLGVPTATCILHVPTGSKSLYAATSQWKNFTIVEQVDTFAVFSQINISGAGTVTGSGAYPWGRLCTLTATPAPGYSFTKWTENGVDVATTWTDNGFTKATDFAYSFYTYDTHALVANFALNNYQISTAGTTKGGAVTGGGSYAYGSTCSVQATPAYGYRFIGWRENGSLVSSATLYSFTVRTARNLVACFSANITATANSSNWGSVSGGVYYEIGSKCTLYAQPNSSYIFSKWTENGAVVSTEATYTFTVDSARSLVANFLPLNNAVSVSPNSTSNGTVSGGATYTYGSSCTLTATAKPGYVFTGWTENGVAVSSKSNYTFTVTSARTLVANFETVKVVVAQPDGSSETTYPSFFSGTATVTPATGFMYSVDGGAYQASNVLKNLGVGTHSITLKSLADSEVSPVVFAVVSASGVVTPQNYKVQATNCSCRDTNDGKIEVTLDKIYEYEVEVIGTNNKAYDKSIIFTDKKFSLSNLSPDTYTLIFKINYLTGYTQTFKVVVSQPEDLSVLKVSSSAKSAQYSVSGADHYYATVNGQSVSAIGDTIRVPLQLGENKVLIRTDRLCQGIYEETIYNDGGGQVSLFPNPTTGKITIGIPSSEEEVSLQVISLGGSVEFNRQLTVPSNHLIDVDLSSLAAGTYVVVLRGEQLYTKTKMVKR